MNVFERRYAPRTFDERHMYQRLVRAIYAHGLFSAQANDLRQKLGQMIDKRLKWEDSK